MLPTKIATASIGISNAADLAGVVIDSQPFGSLLLNAKEEVCFWSSWLNRWTGIAADQAVGKRLDSLFPGLFQTEFVKAMNAALLDNRQTEWSQRLDPERLDRVESVMTSSSQEIPLHRVIFIPIEVVGYGRCCLVQFTESPYDPVVTKQNNAGRKTPVDLDGGNLPVYLKSEQAAVMSVDSSGIIQSANGAAESLFAYGQGELAGKPVRVILPDLNRIFMQGAYDDADVDANQDRLLEGATLNGETLKLRLDAFPMADGSEGVGLLCRDISRETVSGEALFQQRELLSRVCEQVADGIVVVDKYGYIEHINPTAQEMLGVDERVAGETPIREVMSLVSESGEPLSLPVLEAIERETVVTALECSLRHSGTAEPVSMMVTGIPIRDRKNRVVSGLMVFRATSEARRVSNKLSWQARHDPLTQLANRAQLEAGLVRAIESAKSGDSLHTLLYIDLYNFSVVNDTCGHKAGDELLRRFARLLEKQVSPQELVARIGNDEFAVLIVDRPAEEARQIAEEILWQVKAFSFPWGERRLKIGASIGAKVIDKDVQSEIDALLGAGASCSMAKELGRNRIHFNYRSKEVIRRQSLAEWIPLVTEALEENRFVLYSQPIVTAGNTKRVKHHEVLIRMLDDQGNRISPGKFIPAAEHYGMVEDIDRWVFDQVLSHLQRKQAAGDNTARYAINLSGNTVSDESLKDYFIARFRETGIDPRRLQFEVTETAAIRHFDRAIDLIRALKDEGCYFALDDFGSGLSSLGYLKELPVDYLKIDGSFIRAMELNEVDYSMVSTINHLGQILGIKTIAECVETESQLAMLQDIGVDYIQGYIIGAPQPIA